MKRALIRNIVVRRGFGDDYVIGTARTMVALNDGARLFGHLPAGGARRLTFLDATPTPTQQIRRTQGEYLMVVGVVGGALLIDPWRADWALPCIARVRFCLEWRNKLGLRLGDVRWLKVARS